MGKNRLTSANGRPVADPSYGAGVARALGIKMEDAMNEDAE